MSNFFQRLLLRAAAIAAILFGAILTMVLAAFTLLAGLLIGLFLTLASWLGMRPRARRHDARAGATPAPGTARSDDVIDIEMREIERPRDQGAKDPPGPSAGAG